MDPQRFDLLATVVGGGGSRRDVLRGLLGSALGAWGLLGWASGEAGAEEGTGGGRLGGRHGPNRRGRDQHRTHGDKKDKNQERKESDEDENEADPDRCRQILSDAGCKRESDGVSIVWKCPGDTHLEGKNLQSCNLIGAQMQGIFLTGANLTHAILNNAHLDGSQAHGAILNNATMVQATFHSTNFGGGKFRGADMRQADFTGAALNSADLADGARQYGAIFQNADLRGVTWVYFPNPRSPFPKTVTHCPDGANLLWPSTCCGHLNGYTTPFCG